MHLLGDSFGPLGRLMAGGVLDPSPVFDDTRNEMADALDELLTAGVTAGLLREGVSGRVVLRALGGICGLRNTGWKDDAVHIATILYDGLHYVAPQHVSKCRG
ncbi:SbtR family transcriptional regulator [Nocardia sp. NBC_00416]|uniref:SbtR family transcriptional regulator n=1 Tax=Nocardia sp. NBC_00416 TaxID=2975991 RepID=UPI002E21F1F8